MIEKKKKLSVIATLTGVGKVEVFLCLYALEEERVKEKKEEKRTCDDQKERRSSSGSYTVDFLLRRSRRLL